MDGSGVLSIYAFNSDEEMFCKIDFKVIPSIGKSMFNPSKSNIVGIISICRTC